MPALYIENDAALILDQFQMVLTRSLINDAEFICHIGDRDRGGVIDGVTAGSPNVISSPGHGLSNGDQVIITQVRGVTDCKGLYTVANVTADTFQLSGSSGTGELLPFGTPAWYPVIPGAVNLSIEYVTGSRARYLLLLPGDLPFANGGRYIAIIDGVGFNFHREFRFEGRVWN